MTASVVAGPDRRDVREGWHERHPVADLGQAADARDRVEFGCRDLTAPEPFCQVEYVRHG
jgi:hypothetical protein